MPQSTHYISDLMKSGNNMDMAAMFVLLPGPFEHAFVPPPHRGSKHNLNDCPGGF